MKLCQKCLIEKSDKEFHKTKLNKSGLYSYCRSCELKRTNERRYENKVKIFNYLKEHPCIDCGNSNPLVLEFDHRQKKESRKHSLNEMVNNRVSWKRVFEEIQKCDVRCANCHRIKTAHEQSNYKLELMN